MVSNGGEVIKLINEEGRQDELPKQWWTMNETMRNLYKKSIKSIAESYAWFLFSDPEGAKETGLVRYIQEVFISYNGEEKRVGVCGYFANASMRKLCEADK